MVSAPDGRHFRSARAWFGLSRDRVAAGSGLAALTIARLETDWARSKPESADRLAAYYARQGVLFLLAEQGGGLRVTSSAPRTIGAAPE
jgi:hypothetical protein